MAFDLSSLQNIDFTNSDNLVFLAIIFVLGAIFVSLLAVFLSGVIKIIKKFTARLFNINNKAPEFNRTGGERLNREEPLEIQEKVDIPRQKISNPGFMGSFMPPEKKAASQPASQINNPSAEPAKYPYPKPVGENNSLASGGGSYGIGPSGQPSINKAAKPDSASMFGGKGEISRRTLEHELRYDPKIWKASRQAGLTLSREERAKLVKETFSSAYGRNISKTDLKWGIRKLNQKMLGTKDTAEHAKIRKEIKFFKKIGGI